jgi:PadR family transcriptional regulator PadR
MSDHLTDLEQLLLLATLRQPDQAYGASLQEDVEQNASRRVSLGSIHLTMARLEDRGLAESRLGEPTGGRGGKARRLYTVTEEGKRELARARRILERMWAGVPQEAR